MTTTNECPWLAKATRGWVVIEGRARLPEGSPRPARLQGLEVAWRFDPGAWAWRFRAEGPGEAVTIQMAMESNWLMGNPVRFDRAVLEMSELLDDDGLPEGGEVETDDEGRPVGVRWLDRDATEAELADVRRGAGLVFGDAMTLGPWAPIPDGWRAPVCEWRG